MVVVQFLDVASYHGVGLLSANKYTFIEGKWYGAGVVYTLFWTLIYDF